MRATDERKREREGGSDSWDRELARTELVI